MVHVERARRRVLMTHPQERRAPRTLDIVGAHPRHAAEHPRARCRRSSRSTCSSTSRSSCARRSRASSRRRCIAAGLTALMILLFLGSWRSTLIVVVSIPLSILVSIIVLACARPDAQPHDARRDGARRRHPGRRRDRRDREHPPQHGAARSRSSAPSSTAPQQIAVAGVRLHALHLHRLRAGGVHHRRGASRSSCRSAMAVVFAMMTSYFLSRTLVPTMVRYLLRQRGARTTPASTAAAGERPRLARSSRRSSAASSACGTSTAGCLAWALEHRRASSSSGSPASSRPRSRLFPLLGRDFFPSVDAGLIKLHVRGAAGHAHRGDRARFARDRGRDPHGHPARARSRRCIDNIGHPVQRHQPVAQRRRARSRSADGEILIALKEEHAPDGRVRAPAAHDAARDVSRTRRSSSSRPTSRRRCSTSGSPAPIDVQVVGAVGNDGQTYAVAAEAARRRSAQIPGRGRRAPRRRCVEAARAAHRRRPHRWRASSA